MKQPVKETIFHVIKIVIAILLAVTMMASVAATMVQGVEAQDTMMAEERGL